MDDRSSRKTMTVCYPVGTTLYCKEVEYTPNPNPNIVEKIVACFLLSVYIVFWGIMVGIPILFVVSLFTDRGYYPNVDAITEKTVQEQPSKNSSPAPSLTS